LNVLNSCYEILVWVLVLYRGELKVRWSLLECSLILLYFTVVGVFVGNCGSVCGVMFPLLGLFSEV
jgi:hypothetical protein